MLRNCPICKKKLKKENDYACYDSDKLINYHFKLHLDINKITKVVSGLYFINQEISVFCSFKNKTLTIINLLFIENNFLLSDFNLENFDKTFNKIKILKTFE